MYLRIPYKLNPYDYQLDMLKAVRDGKNIVYVIHRRGGKDLTCMQALLLRGLQRVGTHIYLFPLQKQAREVIWLGMDFNGVPFLDYIPKPLIESKNEARMTIQLINGSRLVLAGSNNFNSHMGTNPVTIINSEYSLHNPLARQYMNPILIQNGGIEICQYTPRGMNHGYELLEQVKDDPDYFVRVLDVEHTFKHDGTRVVTDEMIRRARRMGMSEETIRQEFYCLPPDTLIQMGDRTKEIKDIEIGDIIISHSGRARKVLQLHKHGYDGELIEINTYGNHRNLKLTPNHQVRLCNISTQKYSWVRADEVKEGDFLCMPKLASGASFISSTLVELIAAYLCDGSFIKNGVQITIGHHQSERIEKITSLAESLGFSPTLHKTSTAMNVVISNTHLCDFLIQHCGSLSHEKHIPLYLLAGNEELFYESMLAGDGCKTKTNQVEFDSFVTVNISLAYGMQLIANTLGYKAGISKLRDAGTYYIEGREGSQRECYNVQIRKNKARHKNGAIKMQVAKYSVLVLVKQINKTIYKGEVHNITVQHDNSYIAEGRAVHNCDFQVGNVGAYFTRELSLMNAENRIMANIPIQSDLPLNTAWDLGHSDATAIWFFQIVGKYVHLVNYFQESDRPMKYFIDYAESFRRTTGCKWGSHYGPHDIDQQHQGWEVTESRLMAARKAGYHFAVTPKINFADGIEQMRYVLDRCRVDRTKCSLGLRALREYARKFDEALNKYSDKPQEGWYLHGVDALRYLSTNYMRFFLTPDAPFTYQAGNI